MFCIIIFSGFYGMYLKKLIKIITNKFWKSFKRSSNFFFYTFPEAVDQKCSVKKVFLEISRNSQENTRARVCFFIKWQVFSCEFCEISKSTYFSQYTSGGCSSLRFHSYLKHSCCNNLFQLVQQNHFLIFKQKCLCFVLYVFYFTATLPGVKFFWYS